MARKVLTYVLAGGKGERLDPLTRDRAKPAVPFGGIYRIIDVTLSNCINSGLRRIFVLTQYKSFSLQKHVLAGWRDIVSSQLGEFIDLVPAQQRINSEWYLGTADAIHQNIYTIHDHSPDLILTLAGDHVYKMDYRKMIDFHCQMDADVTMSCIPMPVETSKSFGVVEVDEFNRVHGFQEKPAKPKTLPEDPTKIYASMGIYLFNKDILCNELTLDAANKKSNHDFGKDIIPQMLSEGRKTVVYDFVDDKGNAGYWRDIGTRDAYYQANMDLVKPDPEFDIYDKEWPLRTNHLQYPPVKTIGYVDESGRSVSGIMEGSLIAGGCINEGAHVSGSVLSPNVCLGKGALVEDSILMDGVIIGQGAKVRNAIVDKDNIIAPKDEVGYDLAKDKKRFVVTSSGIVIVEKKRSMI